MKGISDFFQIETDLPQLFETTSKYGPPHCVYSFPALVSLTVSVGIDTSLILSSLLTRIVPPPPKSSLLSYSPQLLQRLLALLICLFPGVQLKKIHWSETSLQNN